MQPALIVLVLAGIPQRLVIRGALAQRGAGYGLPLQPAEGVVLPGPAQMTVGVGDLQRGAVQVSVQPVDIRLRAAVRLLDGRQRRPRAGRVVAPAAPRAIVPLLLQQPVALPQEAGGLRALTLISDRLAGAPAQRVVDVVLLAQAAAAADQVAPGVVAVKQPLPVRQPVADHRDGRRIDQVVRQVVLQAAGQRIVAFNTLPPVPLLASRISPFTVLARIKPDTTSVRFFTRSP